MIRICFFNGGMSRGGGTEKITQMIANALSTTGRYNVSIVSLSNTMNSSFFSLSDDIYHSTLFSQMPNGKLGVLKIIWKLSRLLNKERYDLLINVDVMLCLFSIPARFFKKTKMIAWEMFNFYNDIGTKKSFKVRKNALKFCDYYITQTNADAEIFKQNFKVKCPITFIYNPVEIDIDYTDYNGEAKRIMTAGHFFYTKGFDLAVDVAQKVLEKHADWEWHFYGDGTELNKIKTIVNERNLGKNIIFDGRKNDLKKYYRDSSIYVMTSRTEGFGLVLIEAQSNNLPTIAFDVPFGPNEIIADQINGFLVKAFDVEDMSKKINTLIENINQRTEFSKNAKKYLNKFDLKQITNRWCELIDKVIGAE